MELFVLRHGIAAKQDARVHKTDADRPLTRAGMKEMRKNARGMKALGLKFKHILSSPYVRADQTAMIVAEVFKMKGTRIGLTENLEPDKPFGRLVREIRAVSGDAKDVLLVGHEPHLSGFISFLLAGNAEMSIELDKGGFCHLRAEKLTGAGCAELIALLTPLQLQMMGDGHRRRNR